MSKLKSYHFSCGNSTNGTIGFCARVRATSKKRAIAILHEALPESVDVDPYLCDNDEDIEYVQVYISTENLKVTDIDEWEHVDEDDEEEE